MLIKKIILSTLTVLVMTALAAQKKSLRKGMIITQSVKIKKKMYRLDGSSSLNDPVLIIEGDHITVDFNDAVISGSGATHRPDEFKGLAILVRKGKHITIKNLKVRGFKVAFMAKDVEHLTIDHCDFSFNFRQHLNSTQEKEDISDWMSYHHNEKDEWLRYGAAIYLRDCDFAVVSHTRVTGGQNALMMTDCNEGKIFNNDFSFNSGIGIGMYRCSKNTVAYNRLDFNVRGYSHGIYNRGQDSAGILVYEQSNENVFYSNSVTHGGDGFFLWAGQTTMDSGKGGCNDNKLIRNDFSYAPTNGIELTFSRNIVRQNKIFECDHGIWGGYSFNTVIAGNQFRNNRIGIAIEHGQENDIHHNIFFQDKEAIRLWGRKEQPVDWGYARYRDTRSRDYNIINNNFSGNGTVLNLNRTQHLRIFDNLYSGYEKLLKTDSTVTGIDTTVHDDILLRYGSEEPEATPDIPSPMDPFKGNTQLAGRNHILITEWGPYDYRSPVIWLSNPADTSSVMKFDLIGPEGSWRIKTFRGITNISSMNGSFPAELTAVKTEGKRTDIYIELEYRGAAITTPFGETVKAGRPYLFRFKKFFQPVDFDVVWLSYDFKNHDPIRSGQLVPPNVRLRPIQTEKTDKLDYAWWGGIKNEMGEFKQFVTSASGIADFEKGEYEMSVTWDDAVRVYIDDSLVINEWNPSQYDFDESPNKKVRIHLEGEHQIRVEHVELGGFATLSLKFNKLE